MVTKGKLGWGEEMKKDECFKGNEEKTISIWIFLVNGYLLFWLCKE